MENEVFIKLDEKKSEVISKTTKKTFVNYEVFGDFISVDSLWYMVEDLLYTLNNLEDDFEKFKANVNDNYKQISEEEQFEVHDYDFM